MTQVHGSFVITMIPGFVKIEDLKSPKTVNAWGAKADRAARRFTRLLAKGGEDDAAIWLCQKVCNGF